MNDYEPDQVCANQAPLRFPCQYRPGGNWNKNMTLTKMT